MNKKQFWPLIFLIIVVIFAGIIIAKKYESSAQQNSADIIFYYGKECPHCQKVEKWLQDNKIGVKVKFISKEVYHNQTNASELGQKALACGLNTNAIGVPFLWNNNKCYVGETEVTNFFKAQAGIK